MSKKIYGKITIVVLMLIPILIWLAMQPLSSRFNNFFNFFRSVGQILGLEGMTLLSISFLLNSRLSFLENFFGGLDKMYITHKNVGTFAFVLILFHPLALAIKYLKDSPKQAVDFLLPKLDLAVSMGSLALILMAFLIILTFFVYLKYEKWNFSHKFLGVVLIFAIMHFLLIKSDVSNSNLLKYYLLILSLVGLSSYFYRTILGKGDLKKLNYFVEKVKMLNSDVVEITLKPENTRLNFKSGQFVFIQIFGDNFSKEKHPFTISSSPKEENLRFSIKMLGDYTSHLKNINEKTLVKIEGPYGRFFSETNKDEIWIAGGIGITPFISKIRNKISESKKIDLFYSVKEEKEILFSDEIKKYQDKNFASHFNCSSNQGHLNVKLIKEKLGEIKNKEIFICGPKAMADSLKEQFLKENVLSKNIHYEEFAL